MAFKLGTGVIELGVTGVGRLGSTLGGLGRMVRSTVGGIAGSMGMLLGAAGIGSVGAFLGLGIKEAAASQEGLSRFQQALEATGGISGVTAEEISGIASSLQKTAGYADDATLRTAALVTQFTNIRGDQFRNLLPLIADISARLDMDMSSAARAAAQALNDPIRGMQQLKVMGVTFTQQQREQMMAMLQSGKVMEVQNIMLDGLKNRFGGAAEAMGKTFRGQLRRFWEALNDVAEIVGAKLLPYLQRLTEWVITEGIPKLQEWVTTLIEAAKPVMEYLTPAFEWFESTVSWVFNSAIYYAKNWRLVIDKVVLEAIVSWNIFLDTTTHIFTVAIPRIWDWFANNWVNMFVDMATATGTVLDNLYKNVTDFFSNLWDYIMSGGQQDWSYAWTPLLDGFKATTEQIPDLISGIKFSDATKSYMDQLAKTSERLASGAPIRRMSKKAAETAAKVASSVTGATSPYNINAGKAASVSGGNVVGLADLAKNIQVSAFKPKPVEEQQLDQMGVQTDLMTQMVGIGTRTNELLAGGGAGGGAVLG